MNWADFLTADSDAIIFGLANILPFDFQMLEVHCSCTSCLAFIFIPITVGFVTSVSDFTCSALCVCVNWCLNEVYFLKSYSLELFLAQINFVPSSCSSPGDFLKNQKMALCSF